MRIEELRTLRSIRVSGPASERTEFKSSEFDIAKDGDVFTVTITLKDGTKATAHTHVSNVVQWSTPPLNANDDGGKVTPLDAQEKKEERAKRVNRDERVKK